MADPIYLHAWKISEEIHHRVFAIDDARLSPGMMSALAGDLAVKASELRVAFRRANMIAKLELLESRIADLRKSSRDVGGKISRLQSAVVGVHMGAYSLAHPNTDE
ncbi:hypothetical protein IB238_23190 [Rhizobium sp. ARZ01]|uniref:hypothetical protein n=1 Tax=Rhizobium sp. ARZ01 TaxID=2769313 RepID=UPI0017858056|nr:hypothetical protein [Rhizobium sp. ARZ01]MBD9375525.1 hypothetical protein [Rhizobium sp. ARZ01]